MAAASVYYAFLSKKVAIPNNTKLRSVTWNPEHGWLAAGCDEGLLKVLRFEAPTSAESSARGVAAPSNRGMNQTLDGPKERASRAQRVGLCARALALVYAHGARVN